MIPLCIPNISGNEGAYLAECVASTFVSTVGPFVDRFEAATAQATGGAWAVATSSGTTALHTALHFLGVGPGDHVIIPSLTFIATANAVAHCHATPIILDVDADSWGMDAGLLQVLLNDHCQRDAKGVLRYTATGGAIKVVMPVFAMGLPADMDAIVSLAKAYGLAVVADVAAAVGAQYQGKDLAHTGADLTALSFNGNKLVTAGGGGALVGAAPADGAKIKHLTATARLGAGYDHDIVGFNYRMTNLQAAVGVAQLERLDEFLQAKARIAQTYASAFGDTAGLLPFPALPDRTGSHWLSGIFAPDASLAQMENLRSSLIENGVEARSFWKPIHLQQPYLACPRHLSGLSDALWQRIQPLPCSTQLTQSDQMRVIDLVNRAFR